MFKRLRTRQMKRYLITGASRGIGRAIAEKLAAADVTLLLHGRDTVALADTRKAVEPHCAQVILLIAARTGFANWSAYCMSKFALEGFSQSVREELRDRKIRVINLYPAATDTNIWDHIEGKWPRRKMISPKDVAGAVAYALSRP